MHKYFAKTLFLGKKVEYLTQCHSTNQELAGRLNTSKISEGHLILTDYQTAGKGQRGNAWISESGKNLLFSLALVPNFLEIKKGFMLNVIVGVALQKALEHFVAGHNVEIKWPNDIYIDNKKVGGVLVETSSDGGFLENAIVGIGLNVNQNHFAISTATSLSSVVRCSLDLDEVLEQVLLDIESQYLKLKAENIKSIMYDYHQNLRWRGEVHEFESRGETFSGEIIGINEFGKLMVKHTDELHSYDVKDIIFIH
ncbi:MAG: biotin--[acetyl-CoA-carboxylase] ligase [Cyclobacteriaceae bacterium]